MSAKPETIAKAAQIDGVTPAALAVLILNIRQSEKKRA